MQRQRESVPASGSMRTGIAPRRPSDTLVTSSVRNAEATLLGVEWSPAQMERGATVATATKARRCVSLKHHVRMALAPHLAA
jgi:hypothetical protein